RIFLPYGLSALEWASFPNVFARALRHYTKTRVAPATHEERRRLVAETLENLLKAWYDRFRSGRKRGAPVGRFIPPQSLDVGADICEAIGRLGIHEAQRELLDV